MLHVHDNKGHGDEHLPPSEGRIDWLAFMRELVQIHFHGPFILEIASGSDPEIVMERARKGRSYLRSLARRIAMEPTDIVPHV
jgi:sugar phosphate isomerase/epimerase